jgi:uncharacterized protein (TIGR03032 family)
MAENNAEVTGAVVPSSTAAVGGTQAPPEPRESAAAPTGAPPGAAAAPGGKKPDQPWLEVTASRHFAGWLNEQKISLAFTTYQAGKVLLLGVNPDGRLSIFERTFSRCMGLWADSKNGRTLWLSSLYQIWKLEDSLAEGEKYHGHDRLYVPRLGYTTGDVDAHDIAIESSGRLVFVNTLFSCLATLSDRRSFVPLWRPSFVSKFAPEDRCHLNGLATENGKAAYVTSCSFSDVSDGWRDRRQDGGCVIDVRTNQIVCRGFSMPHSPRVHEGKLYMHNSGTGWMGTVDLSRGAFEPIVFCPGYLRGLAFHGGYAIVGLSKPRDRTFTGLTLDSELKKREAEPQCGLQIIDLKNGDVKHWVKVEGVVTELYDVSVLKGVIRPMALGFKTDEIQRTLAMDEPGKL